LQQVDGELLAGPRLWRRTYPGRVLEDLVLGQAQHREHRGRHRATQTDLRHERPDNTDQGLLPEVHREVQHARLIPRALRKPGKPDEHPRRLI
jgi:hypothetical protein